MEVADYENGLFSSSFQTNDPLPDILVVIFGKIMAFIVSKVPSGFLIKVKELLRSFFGKSFFAFLVNANQSILPNITIGYQIRDSCWFAPVALEQTIEFIGNSVLTSGDTTSNTTGTRSRLAAIIGPGDSSITMQTHNILQLFEMPQIGYSATARQLSDKEKFKYFTRVIASDTQQAQAIVDIIRQFKWSYVATIGTEGRAEKDPEEA